MSGQSTHLPPGPALGLSSAAARMVTAAAWRPAIDDRSMAELTYSFSEKYLQAGESLHTCSSATDSWLGVVSGLIKVCTLSEDGDSVTYAGLAAGAWFGESTQLWDHRQRLQIVALRPSHVVLLPRSHFDLLVDRSAAFNRYVVGRLQGWLLHFMSMVRSDRSFSTEQRVAHTLTALFDPTVCPGVGKVLQISQHEVGDLCGLSRQSTNRALRLLESFGAIEVCYGQIRLKSVEQLQLASSGGAPDQSAVFHSTAGAAHAVSGKRPHLSAVA